MTAGVKSFREEYGAELDDLIAGIANDPAADAAARQAARERAETDRLARHTRLVDLIVSVQRGALGKNKDSSEAIAAIERVLVNKPPRECDLAQLVTCESIIHETKTRIRKAKQARRGAK